MNKTVVLYAVSSLAVIALAAFYPKIAAFFVGLLILGVLAEHGNEYAALLDAAQGKTGSNK